MVNEVYCICERASGECEVLMVMLLEMCNMVVKINKLYVLFKNQTFPFFFIVKYLLKMCCQPHTLSIHSSRNFIEENRFKKSTHHTLWEVRL